MESLALSGSRELQSKYVFVFNIRIIIHRLRQYEIIEYKRNKRSIEFKYKFKYEHVATKLTNQ